MISPKVSVIIPTYNGQSKGFLGEAIESVLAQTYKNFELFVIDDGSQDKTKSFCEKYSCDKRFFYFHQKNSGVAAARNFGIKKSSGQYICFLDDDDVWDEKKLEIQTKFVLNKSLGDFGLCYTPLEIITKSGARTARIQANYACGNVYFQMLVENLVNCTSSVMVSKKVLDDVGLFKKDLSYAEDYDLWLRVAKKYSLYSVPGRPLVFYREHDANVSKNLDKIDFYARQVVEDNFFGTEVEKKNVFNMFYKRRADYRFWLGDYKKFRKYFLAAKSYGYVDFAYRARFILSYFPRIVSFLRVIRRLG